MKIFSPADARYDFLFLVKNHLEKILITFPTIPIPHVHRISN